MRKDNLRGSTSWYSRTSDIQKEPRGALKEKKDLRQNSRAIYPRSLYEILRDKSYEVSRYIPHAQTSET